MGQNRLAHPPPTVPIAAQGWAKGTSGNPGGRPKGYYEAIQRCRMYFGNGKGWGRIMALAASADERIAWAVHETLFAYAYGRPTQVVSNPDGSPLDLSTRVLVLSGQDYSLEDLRGLLAEIRERKALATPAPITTTEPSPTG